MATSLKLRRGTTTAHSTFTGAEGEVTVDTTKDTIVVHDGSTAGGFPLAKESGSNITAGTLSATSISDSGNLTFTGTGNRIRGDFSNATHANRLAFQTSVTNSATSPFIIPNGTGTASSIVVANASDPTNSSYGQFLVLGSTEVRVASAQLGTGAALPMTFHTGGSERMRIDTSGNVGIGTSSPSAPLTLKTRAADNISLRILQSSNNAGILQFTNDPVTAETASIISTNTYCAVQTAGYLSFGTNGATERMRIDSSGNVGINTSSPNFNSATGTVCHINNSTVGAWSLNHYTNGTTGSAATDGFIVGALAGEGYVYNYENTPLVFGTNNAERMRIDASGNVGIGTSSPAQKVEVANNGYLALRLNNSQSGAWKSEFQFSNGGNLKWSVGTDITSSGNNNFYFYDNVAGQQRMSIDSSGNLLVNTTDTTMFNNTSGNGMCYRVNSSLDIAASSDNCLILNRMTSTGPIAEFRYAGTIVGSITVSGSATAYVTSSDYRLKENIAPMTGALDVVAQLKPVKYNWKVDGSDGQGFIAHELQEVVPDCVSGEKDAVDEEGNPVYQGIDTSFLVATLTAAIQELKAELDVVKAELNTLKGN